MSLESRIALLQEVLQRPPCRIKFQVKHVDQDILLANVFVPSRYHDKATCAYACDQFLRGVRSVSQAYPDARIHVMVYSKHVDLFKPHLHGLVRNRETRAGTIITLEHNKAIFSIGGTNGKAV